MSDLVSGGNVHGAGASFWQMSNRARFSLFTPFLLPVILLLIGARSLIVAASKNLSSQVSMDGGALVARIVNPDSGGNFGQGFSYLGFGTSLILLYTFMVLPLFSPKLRLRPRLSFLIAVLVGFTFVALSFYVRPSSNAPAQVQTWGQEQLGIPDLNTYTTVKDDIKQTFTVKNTKGKEVTFGLTSRTTADYIYYTYTIITPPA